MLVWILVNNFVTRWEIAFKLALLYQRHLYSLTSAYYPHYSLTVRNMCMFSQLSYLYQMDVILLFRISIYLHIYTIHLFLMDFTYAPIVLTEVKHFASKPQWNTAIPSSFSSRKVLSPCHTQPNCISLCRRMCFRTNMVVCAEISYWYIMHKLYSLITHW